MQTLILIVFVFSAVAIIGLVLIQHGKGADAGAAFGGGASGSVFGAKGSASFLTKLTTGLAALFFILSIVLANQSKNTIKESNGLIRSETIVPKSTSSPVKSKEGVPDPIETGIKIDNGDGIPGVYEKISE